MRPFRSYAKINLFLKIIGTRGDYHELVSRFWRIDSLYDTLIWLEGCESFTVRGKFSCEMRQNSIYKAKEALIPHLSSTQKRELEQLGVSVEKHIPEGAGLGGGSSNAATFLLMVIERFNLRLSLEELAGIGARVGADVPFFIFGYKSANVFGIGEHVKEVREIPARVELFTPPLEINTGAVYRHFRREILGNLDLNKQAKTAEELCEYKGSEILEHPDPLTLNDLYPAALACDPSLREYALPGRFFSGSGSTFFAKRRES
ncbi:MAG: 4-(cytidine 5'-diphospho)-2-C-methyl-D-erythritol kinase [Wolinella sp.]